MAEDALPRPRLRATLTPAQLRNRERVEALIGVAAPFLDLVLAVGDRISRVAEPREYEYYAVRADELPREPRDESAHGRLSVSRRDLERERRWATPVASLTSSRCRSSRSRGDPLAVLQRR